MGIALKFPTTLQERIAFGPAIVRFPGTWDEYWELAESAEYNVEFQNNEILAMSYESDPHSRIAASVLRILGNLFLHDDQVVVHDMNRPIYIESTGAVYTPDTSVVSEPGKKYEYRPGMNAEMTPVVVVEVLSPTTRSHDLEDKLPGYKSIPGIQHIIYIENASPYVTVYTKLENTGKWDNKVYGDLADSFQIGEKTIALKEIYHKVAFENRS